MSLFRLRIEQSTLRSNTLWEIPVAEGLRDKQRSAVNTNSISHLRRELVERKLVVQDKLIGGAPFHPRDHVSLQALAS